MSGYKRVNFYELCRLCASNQQKEKTHIFQEEGRKIQLQNKIQSCLSLTVCENDFLPKVVCSQCLRSLEECYIFRKECVSSESMLSSYFKNFRYTEDFKKSGKVYIKDTSGKTNSTAVTTQTSASNEPVSSTTTTNLNFERNPAPQPDINKNCNKIQQQQPLAYSINPLNLANFKNVIQNVPKHVVSEALGNLTVNANNEIINIAQLVDLDSFVYQTSNVQKKPKITRKPPPDNLLKIQDDPSVIKIQVTQNQLDTTNDFDLTQLKLPQKNSTIQNKFASYSIKIDDTKNSNITTTNHQTVLINPLNNGSELNQNHQMLYAPQTIVNMPHQQQIINQQPIHSTSNCTNFQQVVERSSFVTTKQYVESDELQLATKQQQNFPTMQLNNNSFPTNSKNHVCDICRKTFKRREHLYQHIKLHTGFRPFTCESCNKSFMRKEHLLRHMTSHSGQKNFTCNICEKSFSRNDNLLKHRKTHDKQTSFTCEICQKQFVMKHYYVAHKLTHETDKCAINGNNSWGLLKV